MSEDTKKAIEIIAPLFKELNITVNADEKFLYLNGQAIGIACNSTYATIMESIGYLFLQRYLGFRQIPVSKGAETGIKRYWVNKAVLKMFKEMEREQ